MQYNKSQFLMALNLLLIIITMICSIVFEEHGRKLLTLFVLPMLFALPLLILIRNIKILKYLSASFLLTFLLIGMLGANLKWIKNILPYPKIGELNAIGYDHYFNYPLSLDAFVIYSLLLFPFVAVVITWIFFKKRKYESH